MVDLKENSSRQERAESDVERYRKELGPFVTATQMTRMPMVFLDANSEQVPIVFANDSFLRLTGYTRNEVLGMTLCAFLAGGRHPTGPTQFNEVMRSGEPAEFEVVIRRKDLAEVPVCVFTSSVANLGGSASQYFVSLIDLTRYKESDKQLRISEQRFRMAANAAGLGIIDIDFAAGRHEWSNELREIVGVDTDFQPSVAAYEALIHPDDRAEAVDNYLGYVGGDGSKSSNTYRVVRHVDASTRWVSVKRDVVIGPSGDASRVVITVRDITAERLEQDNVMIAATHDLITGLPNRSLFKRDLELALSAGSSKLSLLLMDLDHFKDINDIHGHQAGDAALVAFADRVSALLSPKFFIARLAGDEFAVILPAVDRPEAVDLANDLLGQLRLPFSLEERWVDIRASIGVSTYPADGAGYSALLYSADLALYAAKEAGGGTTRAFTPELRGPRQKQLSMIRNARAALANGWIEPFYQPKIELLSGRISGFEALLRLRHPRAGVQSPERIASAFDDAYLAPLLGAAMGQAVVGDLRSWIDHGVAVGKVAINASPTELRDPHFTGRLLASLDERDIPADRIELEITETALLDDRSGSVTAALQDLRTSGVTVALDDFGTGFSSLSHLRDFPVDTIKIDRSFVAQIANSLQSRSIIAAVLQLGEALGMNTVAEGVETGEQADFLREHRCTLAQGFLYSPAVDRSRVEALLRR